MTYHSDTLAFKKSELLEILQAIDSSFSFDAVLKTTNDNNKAFPIQEATVTQPQSFIDYKSFLFKKPLLSIHEAACIISEDDPNTVTRCEHDTNFDQNFNNYLHAFNFVDAAIKANDLACDDSQFYGIKNTDLKNYLISTDTTVDGFTDTVSTQNQSNFGTPAIQQAVQNTNADRAELEQLKLENEVLKAEIEKLKQAQIEQKSDAEIETTPLVGLNKFNQLAQDRNAMARIMAVYLWEQEEHKDKLPKDIALLVMKEMRNYCADDDIPQTTETMKRIISSVTPEHAKNKRGRPPKKTMP